MAKKRGKAIMLISSLFLGGHLVIFLTSWMGETWAKELVSTLSRPANVMAWSYPNSRVMIFYHLPLVFGGALIVTSIVFAGIMFASWCRN